MFENHADILAEDAETEEDGASDQGGYDHERGPAGDGGAEEACDEGTDGFFQAEYSGDDGQIDRQAERNGGKRGRRGPRQFKHFRKRVLGFAGCAGRAFVAHGALGEADPAGHTAQETVGFAHFIQRVKTFARKEPEIAGIDGKVAADKPAHAPVEEPGRGGLEDAFALAALALAIDHVIALTVAVDHAVNHAQRILEVGIHQDDGVAGSVIETGRGGELVAEVSGELQDHDAGIAPGPERCQFHGAVAAAVVDQHHLHPGRELVHEFRYFGAEQRKNLFFVIERDHQRQGARKGFLPQYVAGFSG